MNPITIVGIIFIISSIGLGIVLFVKTQQKKNNTPPTNPAPTFVNQQPQANPNVENNTQPASPMNNVTQHENLTENLKAKSLKSDEGIMANPLHSEKMTQANALSTETPTAAQPVMPPSQTTNTNPMPVTDPIQNTVVEPSTPPAQTINIEPSIENSTPQTEIQGQSITETVIPVSPPTPPSPQQQPAVDPILGAQQPTNS